MRPTARELERQYNSSVRETKKSEPVKRSQQLRDKSRNEQQKSMLLKESYTLRQERKARELCEESKKIMERSQKLCDQAEKLRRRKKKRAA